MKNKFNPKTDVLKKITSKIKQYKIFSFDIETYKDKDGQHKFLLGGFYDDKYHSFTDKYKMHHYMNERCSREKNCIIYATNLGFDFNALYYDTEFMSQAKIIMRNGSLITAKLDNITFSDTMNFSPSSVESLGKLLKVHKLTHPKFLGKKPINKKEWKYLIEYNSMDCKISKMFMENFQKVINDIGGELKLTIASTSMNLYRRKYMPIEIYKELIDVKDFIVDGYYGGRTECFKRGRLNNINENELKYSPKTKTIEYERLKMIKSIYKDGVRKYFIDYYLYDFNSMYNSVMRNKYPLPKSAHMIEDKKGKLTDYYIKKYEGVSDVIIECPYMYYPLLPYRMDEKLIFPTGIFRGNFTHLELRKALSIGYKINKIYKIVYYTETFYPFKYFVTDIYKLRMSYKDNPIYYSMIKTIGNSLYGKFATKSMKDFKFLDMDSDDFDMKDLEGAIMNWRIKSDGTVDIKSGRKGFKETDKENNQGYILPILSVYTTAYGRILLYDKMIELQPLYIDTDSLLSIKIIKSNMNLGGLKLEKKCKIGILVRPKYYELVDELHDDKLIIKVKGVRRINFKMMTKLLNNECVNQLKFTKLKESIRMGIEPNMEMNFTKTLSDEDTKRDWLGKKFNKYKLQDSKPIHIS